MDLQQRLALALAQRNLKEFDEVLRIGGNPNEPDSNNISVYEAALSTAGCADYIRLCIEKGCSANYVNERLRKAAINYAVESGDCQNLQVLLSSPDLNVNHKYNNLTPLNSLAKQMSTDNASQLMECMRLLLNRGASANIEDEFEMTPLLYVISSQLSVSQKEQVVDLFLQHSDLLISSELREELEERLPHIILPAATKDVTVTREQLLHEMHQDNAEGFQQLLASYQGDKSDFVAECIAMGLHRVFDSLLATIGRAINFESERYNRTLVEIAIAHGNWYALQELLQHNDLSLPSSLELLPKVIGRMNESPVKVWSDYKKCFQVLLESKHVRINKADQNGRSPLHYAILFNNEQAVLDVLRHGAYLGAWSKFEEIAIRDIEPELLKQHFDDCLTANELSRGDDNFKITLDYKNLKLHQDISSKNQSEMEPIVAMGESEELRHLLTHPLISTFIALKWQNVELPFLTYFIFSLIFSVCAAADMYFIFSVGCYGILRILSWTGFAYFALCALIELVLAPKLWSIGRVCNLVHVAMLLVSLSICSPQTYYSRIIGAFTIVMIAARITKLVGYLPFDSIATHTLMLLVVFKNFLKSCISYSILVIAFGLSFYILNFHNMSKKSVLEAIFKTVVMATGEFNGSELDYKNNIFGLFFFVCFVFTVSIVLMNLLGAIAIADTQEIQSQAKVNGLICRANLLNCYEKFLSKPLDVFKSSGSFLDCLVKKSIPLTVSTFPNDKSKSTRNTFATARNAIQMNPLISQNHTINMPESEFVTTLSKHVIRQILQIRRSKKNTTQEQ